ncbi:MAG: CcoQ/FixQ family Cbb3-type cytochrome c oxidase assembly chaperone [Crocinitomicaceae bacterium]|nr:CcoQ/FixQ family Cbb3-type cytochrome c oxidase assembly chaperone [Crocinitomicaceae bacterium]|tara:strand:+ start:7015 stop:7188 length:174 start_codon:yes stop_codon:yes gene_type:complete
MKFIKGHMASIDGIEIFPIITLVLFTAMFALVLAWVFSMKKETIDEVSSIPLDGNDK